MSYPSRRDPAARWANVALALALAGLPLAFTILMPALAVCVALLIPGGVSAAEGAVGRRVRWALALGIVGLVGGLVWGGVMAFTPFFRALNNL